MEFISSADETKLCADQQANDVDMECSATMSLASTDRDESEKETVDADSVISEASLASNSLEIASDSSCDVGEYKQGNNAEEVPVSESMDTDSTKVEIFADDASKSCELEASGLSVATTEENSSSKSSDVTLSCSDSNNQVNQNILNEGFNANDSSEECEKVSFTNVTEKCQALDCDSSVHDDEDSSIEVETKAQYDPNVEVDKYGDIPPDSDYIKPCESAEKTESSGNTASDNSTQKCRESKDSGVEPRASDKLNFVNTSHSLVTLDKVNESAEIKNAVVAVDVNNVQLSEGFDSDINSSHNNNNNNSSMCKVSESSQSSMTVFEKQKQKEVCGLSAGENAGDGFRPGKKQECHTEIGSNTGRVNFPDIFRDHVTIGKYISVKGDFTLRSSEALIESPSLISPFLLKEPDVFPSQDKEAKSDGKGFFLSSVGQFLIGLGYSRANEWHQRDLTIRKMKQMKKEGKRDNLEQELKKYQSRFFEAKKANEPFTFSNKICKICNFATESTIVLEGHLLVPHVTQRREYQCSYCSYLNRDPKEILRHMKITHDKVGIIQPPTLFYECPYCDFEINSKVKLNSHLSKCLKYYDHATTQVPPKDFDFPCLTPKPITVAVVKAYEKSLSTMQRGRGRPKKLDNVPDSFHHHLNQLTDHQSLLPNQSYHKSFVGMPLSETMSPQTFVSPVVSSSPCKTSHSNVASSVYTGVHSFPNNFFQVVNNGGQNSPSTLHFPYVPGLKGKKKQLSTMVPPGIQHPSFRDTHDLPPGLPQPPKLQGPYPVQLNKSTPLPNPLLQPASLVVCEICDGYIKDMEQLRTHMQLIHKVKIHPKMLVSRPPLNCQKCQWRFFTDQGLERHLLGSHGLVTSNMQELANKNKDTGCCTICGRVYASKLVAHMNQVHKITLKPAHLSYKCTVCSATFNLYRLFENHVYLVHSGAKRPFDGSDDGPSCKKAAKVTSSSNLKSSTLSEKENGAS